MTRRDAGAREKAAVGVSIPEHGMDRPARIGISPALFLRPLAIQLLASHRFDCRIDFTGANAIRLRERELDAALLTPLDYARESSDYRLLRGCTVSSPGSDGSILLMFREGAHQVTTLAADPSSLSEIVLARIILAEEFDQHPTIIPARGAPEELLRNADAALLYGDAALREATRRERTFDLVEAWTDMTDLPFVHGVWCGYDAALSEEDRAAIADCHQQAHAVLATVAQEAAPAFNVSPGTLDEYLGAFTYRDLPGIEESVTEFLTYAFYHTLLQDIPDLRYYGDQDETNPTV